MKRDKNKFYGCFVSLVVGDAVGTPLEFVRHGSLEPITETSCDMLNIKGIQGTSINAVPTSHTHVLKNDGRFESPVKLFDYLVSAGRRCGAYAIFRVAGPGAAFFIIHHGKRFFGLHIPFHPLLVGKITC
jgi:hypothetical protein